MIYKKSLIKELTLTAVGIFIILLIIMLSSQIINLLGRTANGLISMEFLKITIALSIIGLTPLMMILIIFLSILTVLTRYWRDSEMQIWLSSGISLTKWINPILLFSTPLIIITAILSIWIVPWAYSKGNDYIEILKQKPNISFIEQGTFIPSKEGVFFLNEFNNNSGDIKNLFISSIDSKDKTSILTLSKLAKIHIKKNNIILDLSDATRYNGITGQRDYTIMSIPDAKINLNFNNQSNQKINNLNKKIIQTIDLIKSNKPFYKAELMWRLSMPIVAIILSLIAIPLSYYNPRNNHTYNLIVANLVFFCYQNLLIFFRSGIAKKYFNFWWGITICHLIMIILTFILFKKKVYSNKKFF